MATILATAAVVGAGGGPAGADTPISQAEGRFLTGTAAGMSFDTVAALNGDRASYPDNPGPNSNDLSGSVLGQALESPLGNVSVPFPGGVTFGAVGQYAKANSDGSAVGASGLVGSNGAINVGGSGDDDFATIDLSKLPMASQLTDLLGNLKLTVGAVSARAEQAAFNKTVDDPSAQCVGGDYSRVSDDDQAGSYQFANLKLEATSPLLAGVGEQLTTNLGTLIDQFNTVLNALPGGLVSVSGLPTADALAGDLSISLADGGVTANLVDGSFTIDMAKILKAAGLDINNLCPNTSLIKYLADALADLPKALSDTVGAVISKVNSSLGAVTVTVAGQALSLTQVTNALQPAIDNLTDNLGDILDMVGSALDPALDALTDNLLDVTVNAQDESDGTFTQTAIQLNLLPGGSGSLPDLPGLPSLPGLPALNTESTPTTGTSTSAGENFAHVNTVSHVRLAAAKPAAAPLASTAADDPVLQLNLATAAVTNHKPTTVAATPSKGVDAATAQLPTGVPAGKAQAVAPDQGVPTLPLVLALVALAMAGGATVALRQRGLQLVRSRS